MISGSGINIGVCWNWMWDKISFKIGKLVMNVRVGSW